MLVLALIGVGVLGYAMYKHYTLAQVLDAVEAEVSKLESEVTSGAMKAEASAAIARIKALL